MSSAAQIDANRTNAQQSTGPKTPEGKARVALNPLLHGLASTRIFLPGEEPEEFIELQKALGSSYQCQHSGEAALVDQAALAWWKLRRIAQWQTEIETACLTSQEMPEAIAKMFGASSEAALKTLHRYEVSANGIMNRALSQLRIHQKQRDDQNRANQRLAAKANLLKFEEFIKSDRPYPPIRTNPIPDPPPPVTERQIAPSQPKHPAPRWVGGGKAPWSR